MAKIDRLLLITTLIGSVVIMIASIGVLAHIIYIYGVSFGGIYDRSGHVIGQIRYIYGGLAIALLGVTFCVAIFRASLKKLRASNKKVK